MADVIAVPAAPTFSVTESWFKKYERLIIVALVLSVGAWGFNKWVNSSASKADIKLAVAAQQLADAKQAAVDLKLEADKSIAAYQQAIDSLDAENSRLSGFVAQRNATLKQTQEKVKTLQPTELDGEWRKLIEVASQEITATVDKDNTPTFHVSGIAAVNTVDLLEEVPVLQQNLTDTQLIVDNQKKELDTAHTAVIGLTNQVNGLLIQNQAQDNACKTEVAAVKADARKSKRNWFIGGVITGATVVGTVAIHLLL